jgi:acetyl esterase
MEKVALGMRVIGTFFHLFPSMTITHMSPKQIEMCQQIEIPKNPVANFFGRNIVNLMLGKLQKGVEVEDRSIPGPAGNIVLRIYTPERDMPVPRPLILNFHGGGWTIGALRGSDWACSHVALDVNAVVVSVEYRLAPKYKFPFGIEDCYTALVWCYENAAALGADASKIGVMGESAGGNLSAVMCLLSKERGGPKIRHQALLYPATDASMSSQSYQENKDAPLLTAEEMKIYYDYYLTADTDPLDWRVSPLYAPDHADLPPTIIVVGRHDPLHDDGVLYAEKLKAAGVPVTVDEYPAMPHGFFNFPYFSRDSKTALKKVCQAQCEALY